MGIDTLANPGGPRRQLRDVERATIRSVAGDGRLRVTLDRFSDRREIAVSFDPQTRLTEDADGNPILEAVDPPAGTRCLVLFPSRGVTGAAAVFTGRYVTD